MKRKSLFILVILHHSHFCFIFFCTLICNFTLVLHLFYKLFYAYFIFICTFVYKSLTLVMFQFASNFGFPFYQFVLSNFYVYFVTCFSFYILFSNFYACLQVALLFLFIDFFFLLLYLFCKLQVVFSLMCMFFFLLVLKRCDASTKSNYIDNVFTIDFASIVLDNAWP